MILNEFGIIHSFFNFSHFFSLEAGGKPSTWLPPGGLVEHIVKKQTAEQTHKEKLTNIPMTFIHHINNVTKMRLTFKTTDTLMPDTTEEITTQVMTRAVTESLLPYA